MAAHHSGCKEYFFDPIGSTEGERLRNHRAHGMRKHVCAFDARCVQKGGQVIRVVFHGIKKRIRFIRLTCAAPIHGINVKSILQRTDGQAPDPAGISEAVDEQQGFCIRVSGFHVVHCDTGREFYMFRVVVPLLMGRHGKCCIHAVTSVCFWDSKSCMICGISLSR